MSITDVKRLNDPEIWKQYMAAVAQSQDRSAYHELYRHFAPKIRSFYLQHGMGNKSDGLTHEVFLKVWQKANSYNPEKASVSTWIFTIVRNLRIDTLRRKKYDEVSEDNVEETASDINILEDLDSQRRNKQLSSLLGSLNSEERFVIQKVYFEDKSHSHAAQELDMTPGVVKSRIRSALKVLRNKLGSEIG